MWELLGSDGQLAYQVIVGAVIILILTGQLITRRQLKDQLSMKDKVIAEWQAAWRVEQKRNDVLASHVDDLTEIARTNVHALQALPRGIAKAQGSDSTTI